MGKGLNRNLSRTITQLFSDIDETVWRLEHGCSDDNVSGPVLSVFRIGYGLPLVYLSQVKTLAVLRNFFLPCLRIR